MALTPYVFTFCLLLLQNKTFCGMLKVSHIVFVVFVVGLFLFSQVLYFKHKINAVLMHVLFSICTIHSNGALNCDWDH